MKAFAGLYCITWGYDQKAESRIQKVEDDSFLHSLFLVVVVCGCILYPGTSIEGMNESIESNEAK